MQPTLNPKQTHDPQDVLVIAPDVVLVAPTDEGLSNPAHDAVRSASDPLTRTGSGFPAGPTVPPVDTTFRPAAVDNIPHDRPSIGGRAVRGFIGLLLAACIGVAALAWQSSGDVAKKIIARWAPQLVLTSWLSQENPAAPAQPAPPAVEAAATNAAPPQPAPPAQAAPAGVAPAAALSPDSAQLLQSMARDLATVAQEVEQLKASIEQLKAGQQQMSRDVAKASEVKASEAKASEPNLRPRMSAPPPRSAAAPARKPIPPFAPRQTAAVPPPQAAAPYVRPPEPQPQATTAQPQAEPEPSSVPRPPMPVR
jgi:hypothetical protein